MKEIVLHIGGFKTGSTSIQRALARAVDKQNSHFDDIIFPRAGRGKDGAHNNLAWLAKGAPRFKPKLGGWLDVARELTRGPGGTAVISSEAFEFVAPEKVREQMLEAFGSVEGVTVVYYVRPHFSRILSGYSQRVKTGQYIEGLDRFVEYSISSKRFAFHERISDWVTVFGSNKVIVRPFIRRLLESRDVVSDFCRFGLNKNADFLSHVAAGEVNASPSREVLEVIRGLARTTLSYEAPDKREVFEKKLYAGLRSALERVYPTMNSHLSFSDESIDKILAHCSDDAMRLDRDYFGGQGLFLDEMHAFAESARKQGIDGSDATMADRERLIHEAYAKVITSLVETQSWYPKRLRIR